MVPFRYNNKGQTGGVKYTEAFSCMYKDLFYNIRNSDPLYNFQIL